MIKVDFVSEVSGEDSDKPKLKGKERVYAESVTDSKDKIP
jgi:hypothetical protein